MSFPVFLNTPLTKPSIFTHFHVKQIGSVHAVVHLPVRDDGALVFGLREGHSSQCDASQDPLVRILCVDGGGELFVWRERVCFEFGAEEQEKEEEERRKKRGVV